MVVKNIKSQKGQAVFEFIFFLPIILILYAIVVTLGSSINGSINQQKAARGYFYARVKNNSTVPKFEDTDSSWTRFGMTWIGWKEKFKSGGDSPLAPCYKLQIPFDGADPGDCGTWNDTKPKFVRVQTVYGICGTTYEKVNGSFIRSPNNSDVDACTIK